MRCWRTPGLEIKISGRNSAVDSSCVLIERVSTGSALYGKAH